MDAGAILVQRKSGGDFLSSIGDLKSIQERMLQWARPGGCWLLITGLSMHDDVITDGHAEKTTSSIKGALIKWNFRGGHFDWLDDDDEIAPWINEMGMQVDACASEPVREFVHVEPVQRLKREPENWVTTLRAFPEGVGRKKVEELALLLCDCDDPINEPPPLVQVLDYVRDGRLKIAHGWGKVLLERMRAHWGLDRYDVRFSQAFESVTIKFDEPLPFVMSGEGVEQIDERTYKFKDHASMRMFRDMLGAINGKDNK
jgi:hypothetical protein